MHPLYLAQVSLLHSAIIQLCISQSFNSTFHNLLPLHFTIFHLIFLSCSLYILQCFTIYSLVINHDFLSLSLYIPQLFTCYSSVFPSSFFSLSLNFPWSLLNIPQFSFQILQSFTLTTLLLSQSFYIPQSLILVHYILFSLSPWT